MKRPARRPPAARPASRRLLSLPVLVLAAYLLGAACVWDDSGRLPRLALPDGRTAPVETAPGRRKKAPPENTPPAEVQKGTVVEGRAVHIADGDTFDLLTDDQKKLRIRMHGIDAPEKAQDFGQVAKERLGKMLQDQRLRSVVADKDRYGRAVCNVYVRTGSTEEWVNRQMVAEGLAWHYVQYSKSPELAAAQQQARAAKRGLWVQPHAQPPWEWRAAKKNKSKPASTPNPLFFAY